MLHLTVFFFKAYRPEVLMHMVLIFLQKAVAFGVNGLCFVAC